MRVWVISPFFFFSKHGFSDICKEDFNVEGRKTQYVDVKLEIISHGFRSIKGIEGIQYIGKRHED
jgi:hypothetical protein